MDKINCVFAKILTENVTECRNDKSRIKRACNAFCSRCKVRVPIVRDLEPVIHREPEPQQMRIEEWLKGGVIDG
jgi:hypothetical protein